MAEKPAKLETGRNSANLIAHNKDSPFQILNVRSLTDSIDDEVGALDIEDAKTTDETTDTDAGETAPEEEDGAEEDTAAEKDETVQKTTVKGATSADQDPRKDRITVVQDNARALDVAAVEDNATVEKDAVGIVAENTEKTNEHHHSSAQMSDNAYSTDEEPELVIDMSFEEEESPKKGERTTSSKDTAESVTEQTDKKTSEHPDPITDGSAEPITLSNESDDDEEQVTSKEATLKVMPKAEQIYEDDADADEHEDDGNEDDEDDVEFVEETSELRDVEGQSIKEEEEHEMEQMENRSEMRTLISAIAWLRAVCNELLNKHHTVQINFANTTVDTKNYEDCLKWAQAYLRGGR